MVLSHLWESKFKQSFQDTLNPLCSPGIDIETTTHYFFHCLLLHADRSTLLNNIKETDSTILNKSESVVTCTLLYGNETFKDEVNLLILNSTVDFILSANRFEQSLYLLWTTGCPLLLFMNIWMQFYNFIKLIFYL